ncbi:hypothetical protein PoB_004875100 [Plakobranchus ocellatus]|uniref:Uncharacterized protein n=1 Tax=Plakobranchus ocellatus TaxID=259542 RepID=A0AAV4BT60_9GAST|nr:hypothetical protein PoB_004875100 [Plakobranchus ocellatus]
MLYAYKSIDGVRTESPMLFKKIRNGASESAALREALDFRLIWTLILIRMKRSIRKVFSHPYFRSVTPCYCNLTCKPVRHTRSTSSPDRLRQNQSGTLFCLPCIYEALGTMD